jgi:hypothetical protein
MTQDGSLQKGGYPLFSSPGPKGHTKSDDNSSHGLKARWAKKDNNSKMGNQIYFKIVAYVDLMKF